MKRISSTSEVIPEVGMGVSIKYYTDSEAATIIQVTQNGKRLVIQVDKSIRTDKNGMSESQDYEFSPDPNGEVHIVTKRKDGTYRLSGDKTVVRIGKRHKYHDYSF